MRLSGRGTRGWIAGLLLLGCSVMSGRPQWGSKTPQLGQSPGMGNPGKDASDPAVNEIQRKQEKLRQDDRQKRLVSDSDKLLALATQLHEEVGKTDKNILSMDVIRRADEIEKLAHNVKERMRN